MIPNENMKFMSSLPTDAKVSVMADILQQGHPARRIRQSHTHASTRRGGGLVGVGGGGLGCWMVALGAPGMQSQVDNQADTA